MTNAFASFEVGYVKNPLINPVQEFDSEANNAVVIRYPSRVEAMALDPAGVAENQQHIYEAGQIDLSVGIYKNVYVEKDTSLDEMVHITPETNRETLVRHAAIIMQKAIGFTDPLTIHIEDDVPLRHCGLGSSSGTIAAVATAINELYGKPIESLDLVRYCAQNHGEEIDDDPSRLVPVQCLGGSALCGNFTGGLVIISGKSTPIFARDLAEDLEVVIGVPHEFAHPDAEHLMKLEDQNMAGFVASGKAYGQTIAYRLVHQVLPGLVEGNLKPCKDLIFDYRWNMGSIQNCSFVLPRIVDIAEDLRHLRHDDAVEIVSLSSVGPGFFALTSDPTRIADIFSKSGMTTMNTRIHNGTYEVIE